jgi:hypothetical protein
VLSSASSVTATVSSLAAIIPISKTQQVINLKLTNMNYLYWCMQMKPYLIGQGVFSFVDDSFPCPSPHVLPSDTFAASITFGSGINQAFLTWK